MTAPLRVLVKLAAVLGIATTVAMTASVGTVLVATPSGGAVREQHRRRGQSARRRPDHPLLFRYGPVTPAKINEALAALYATGLFSDVNISQQGGRIVVRVSENEVINKVAFEGNKKIKDDVLAGEVQSKPRGTLSKATVQADTQRILEVYRRSGRNDVKVNPVTIDRGNAASTSSSKSMKAKRSASRTSSSSATRRFRTSS